MASGLQSPSFPSISSILPQNANDPEIIVIADDLDKDIQIHRALLERILSDTGVGTLSKTLQTDMQQALNLSTSTQSVVSFLGDTGSGKSTTINALLGINLLPTDSSGEACTAIPIEIHLAKPGEFHGEVKYVALEALREEVLQVQTVLRDGSGFEDEFKKMLEKIALVYPELKESELRDLSVDEILATNEAGQKLGTTETLANNTWDDFINDLYEHTVSFSRRKKSQLWPLVDVVKVYIDSAILSDGLVLVDVPGVLDSNRTRADRAQQYLRSSAAVCIVAQAQRAVSNASSFDLLRDVLEQVQYNGHLDRVILINSKSDDFDNTEVQKRLDDPLVAKLIREKEEVDQELQIVEEDVQRLDDRVQHLLNIVKWAKADMTTYKGKLTQLNTGKTVYDLLPRVNGRRKGGKQKGPELTESLIAERIRALQNDKADAEAVISVAKPDLQILRASFKQTKMRSLDIEKACNRQCLITRNAHIQKGQRSNYIKILKQCDEAAAIQSRSGSSIPAEIPDEKYDELKQQVPIFCVSAKAYLHLRKIHAYDAFAVSKFNTLEDTGMPSLSKHLTTLAAATHGEILHNTLNKLTLAVSSIHLHVMNTSTRRPLDRDGANRAVQEASACLQELDSAFEAPYEELCSILRDRFHGGLIQGHDGIARSATKQAVRAIQPLEECPSQHNNHAGLYPQEYKALVFGFGTLNGTRRKINLNAKLGRRLLKELHDLMSRLYTTNNSYGHQALQTLNLSCNRILEERHVRMRKLADAAGVSPYAFAMVEDQFKERIAELGQIHNEMRKTMRDVPSQAYAGLDNSIRDKMVFTYGRAQGVDKGRGVVDRMSTEVKKGISGQSGLLLESCLTEIEEKAEKLTKESIQVLGRKLQRFSESIVQNYQDAFQKRDEYAIVCDDPNIERIRNMLLSSGLISHASLAGSGMELGKNSEIKTEDDEAGVGMCGEDMVETESMFFEEIPLGTDVVMEEPIGLLLTAAATG